MPDNQPEAIPTDPAVRHRAIATLNRDRLEYWGRALTEQDATALQRAKEAAGQ